MTLVGEPPVAAELGKTRLDEAAEVGAEKVLAACPWKVMDNLLPHMVGDVVPLVSQPLIDFLQAHPRRET